MKILVVGSGGREHTLTWKLKQSNKVERVFVAPGNAGTEELATNVDIKDTNINELATFATRKEIDLTFVGPESPLVEGIVDHFKEEDLAVFGPNQKAAQLEGSKVFSKNLMKEYEIPTAKYESFTEADEAIAYIKEEGAPIVVKAEGLAAGKGVIVAQSTTEAVEAVETIMLDEKFGAAGSRIVVEEFLTGEEATVLAFTDGETIVPLIASQDHKPAYDNDEGPNTGGMGAYAPAPVVDEELLAQVKADVLEPTIDGLKEEGVEYKGLIYCGLMIEDREVKVLEYNVRFGDPEAQAVLPLLETDLVDIAKAVNENRLGEIEIEWSNKTAVCVIMASGGYPIDYETGEEITGIKEAEKDEDIIVFQAGTERKDGKLLTAGGRVLGVTAIGEGYQDTIEKAYQGVEEIDFAKAHYRSDIGAKAVKK
ncbi:MAG: phosphoribosylamine--glycine ligase [Halanaerobacter sp.]